MKSDWKSRSKWRMGSHLRDSKAGVISHQGGTPGSIQESLQRKITSVQKTNGIDVFQARIVWARWQKCREVRKEGVRSTRKRWHNSNVCKLIVLEIKKDSWSPWVFFKIYGLWLSVIETKADFGWIGLWRIARVQICRREITAVDRHVKLKGSG